MKHPVICALVLCASFVAPAGARASYFGTTTVRPGIVVSVGNAQEALAGLRAFIGPELRAVLGPAAAEAGALLDALVKLELRHPLAVALLRVDGKSQLALCARVESGGRAAVLQSFRSVQRMLARAGFRRFVTDLRADVVLGGTSRLAMGWMERQRATLLDPVAADPKAYRIAFNPPGEPAGEPALPLTLVAAGRAGGPATVTLGPAASTALRAVFAEGGRHRLGHLPPGVQAAAGIRLREALLTRVPAELQQLAALLRGELVVAQLAPAGDKTSFAVFVHGAGKPAALSAALQAALRPLLPALGAKLKAGSSGAFRLEVSLKMATRAALAAAGLPLPPSLVLHAAPSGDALVLATDPALLRPEARTVPIPEALAVSPLWAQSAGHEQRLSDTPDGFVLNGPLPMPRARDRPLVAQLPALALGLLLRQRVAEAFSVASGSMEPTILAGEHVLVDTRAGREPAAGEIWVLENPREPSQRFVKRVVGLPGDVLELRGHELWRNETAATRRRCRARVALTPGPGETPATADCRIESLAEHDYFVAVDAGKERPAPVTVPPGHVYVLGDNRPNSLDSRHFGPVPKERLLGRAVLVYFSADPAAAVRWARLFMLLR